MSSRCSNRGNPATPYEITEMNALGMSGENVWPGLTHKVQAETLDERLVQTDGVAAEERKVLNCRVVQTFDVLQTAALNEKKHAEEVAYLNRAHKQLKQQLETFLAPGKK